MFHRVMIACLLAQVEDPAASLPIGIMGAVGIAAALYVLLTAVICAMVPYGKIQAGAPFSQAFLSLLSPDDGRLRSAILRTSARFVSFGAVTGALTEPLHPVIRYHNLAKSPGLKGLILVFQWLVYSLSIYSSSMSRLIFYPRLCWLEND